MNILINIVAFLGAFAFMEGFAWFTHKYIMHGFLWSIHKDHHKKDHESWWERNDLFFLFYAAISIGLILCWKYLSFWAGLPVGAGIFAYGVTYFLVHDVFIHQRFKLFRRTDHRYARAIRKAHKVHHKHLGKEHGECFGMLLPPTKFLKEA